MKQNYELMLVLNPALGKDENSVARERIQEVITKDSGEITTDEEWGTRRLAYPIKKGGQTYLEGSYHLTRFKAEKTIVKNLEEYLRLSENVLRHLLVKNAAPKAEAAKVEVPEAEAAESEVTEKSKNKE